MKPFALLFVSFATLGSLAAQEGQPKVGQEPAAASGAETVVSKAYYPTEACVVLDKKLPAKPQVVEASGRELRVCCKKCVGKVKEDAAPWIAKLDKAVAEKQAADYPLDTCPVSGDKLDKKTAHDFVVDGRLVRLCCPDCEKAFADQAEKAKALAKLDAAIVAKHGNAAAKCPVSGHAVAAGQGVNLIYGAQVVRLCGKDCVAKFESDPAKHLGAPKAEK
jgi:hypothetical protein